MEILEDKRAGIVIVTLTRGELILESLGEVARRADIHSGVVMSGIGSVTRARIHTVVTNDYPPQDEYLDLEGPLEVVQFGGIIANYQPHIHISLWDREKRYHGGHLEEGCAILALSEISIHRLSELRLARQPRDASGVMLLGRE
jgi:uncharacterized protein